ncbi:MAG TPA: fused protease/ribonucleoside-triphosphate reductase, partial [Candidatus Hydrogenedentes bacterium]|nr:fused protease/ribonucleoside-triphosphate reductase [Candidatus Hydrogenedentota bacterium]
MLFSARERFFLEDSFLDGFRGRQPEWGPLGYFTFKRTYARVVDGAAQRTEEYWETIRRVVEGCYTIQLNHCRSLKLPWNPQKAQRSAQEMFRLMWGFKFLPPGRGLWMMGTDYIYERGSAALNNCAFVSTDQIEFTFSEPFCFLMDMSMLGVGVAFDTLGAGKVTVVKPETGAFAYLVEDSKEGWVDLVRCLLESYAGKGKRPEHIDFSHVRPMGSPIRTFGGIAPGPGPLMECVENIDKVLTPRMGAAITSSDITDLMNVIGKCVVSGGVRRTAELALGSADDADYLKLKDPELHPERMMAWRWASNNSIAASVGMDYAAVGQQTAKNGEPGYFWLDNARAYGRLKDGVTYADAKVSGTNPCAEQSLESYEICNLVETFPSLHGSYEEYERTLKFAYLYAKTVTLVPTHNERTNAIMLRNRRIGLSQSGIIESFERHGRRAHFQWCDKGMRIF